MPPRPLRRLDGRIVLYHRTAYADSILCTGFQDGTGTYLTAAAWSGVWFSDRPLDANEGAKGKQLLRVTTVLTEDYLARWEWVEDGKTYREWLIPAETVNACASVALVDEWAEDDLFPADPAYPWSQEDGDDN